jgi:hypothetical protein
MAATRMLLAACLLPLFATPAGAYPIPPVPLWDLTAKAELIVIAKVIEVVELPPPDYAKGEFDSHLARLEVLETLKGEDVAYLKIAYPAQLICPAPPDYRQGEKVVAFLERGEDHQLRTVSLSYGTLYARGEDQLEDLVETTRKALALHASGLSGPALAQRKRTWALAAAARPVTRWHGLYELEPRSERMRKIYPRQPDRFEITPEEQAVLADAFLLDEQPDRNTFRMLHLLDGHHDPRLEAAALGWIEGLLALEKPPWLVRTLIETVLQLRGEADPPARMTDDQGARSWNLDPRRLRQIWSQAKQDLGLPTLRPRPIGSDLEP